MKILAILPRVPWPLEKGDKLRAYYLLKELSANHEIIILALNDKKLHPDASKKLLEFCSEVHIVNLSRFSIILNIIKAFFLNRPLQVGYFYSAKAAAKLREIRDKHQPGHVFCQLLRVAEYARIFSCPKTLDYQDVFSTGMYRRMKNSPLWQRPLFHLEYKRLKKYERRIYGWFDHHIVISETDRELLPLSEEMHVDVVPNGVDEGFFNFPVKKKKYDVVFTGNMAYPPNIDGAAYLVNDILPYVRKKYPGISLLLSGATPHRNIKLLASEKVIVSGWVDDIRDSYASSRIFIAPMRMGTGLQNKLLEAMAMGLPCITSPLANKALNAKPGHEILVGQSASECAGHIQKLMADNEFAAKLAGSGRDFVKRNYNWGNIVKRLEGIMNLDKGS